MNSEFDLVVSATTQIGPLGFLVSPKETTTANRAVQSERNRTTKTTTKCQSEKKHPFSSNHSKLPTLLTDILEKKKKSKICDPQQQLGKAFNFQNMSLSLKLRSGRYDNSQWWHLNGEGHLKKLCHG